MIAGKETGCKFFMLFHTGFVANDGTLQVPLEMMDKAFKNKNGKYRQDALAKLHFAFVAEEAGEWRPEGEGPSASPRERV